MGGFTRIMPRRKLGPCRNGHQLKPRRPVRVTNLLLVILGMLVAMWSASPAWAMQHAPNEDTRWAHDTTHVVGTLTLPDDTRQLVIEGPADADIYAVDLLHYGADAVDFRAEQRATAWTLRFDTPQHGPFEAVLRVRAGAPTSRATWRLIPFTGATLQPAPLTRIAKTIETPLPGRSTWGWPFPNSTEPNADANPQRTGQTLQTFTMAFWMRTMQRNAVVASTWTGDPDAPYPLEVVTGPTGRLQVYQGTGTAHHTVRSGTVVADGRWHYVALVYEDATRQTTVYVDGQQVARARTPACRAGRAPLTFGGRPPGPVSADPAMRPFDGTLAWVQMLPEALDDEGLQSLRTTATPHPTAQTYGPWPPLEGEEPGPDTAVRVALPIGPQTPVSDWQAQVRNAEVVLMWTGSHDAGHYVIERSTDRTRWIPFATDTATDGTRLADGRHEYTVVDSSPPADVVFYRVRHVVPDAPDQLSPVLKVGRAALTENENGPHLVGNFPNPFDDQTTIAFDLPTTLDVTLTIWTLDGRLVDEVANRAFPDGYHELPFQADTLPSGTYFLRLQAGPHTASHRMVVVR